MWEAHNFPVSIHSDRHKGPIGGVLREIWTNKLLHYRTRSISTRAGGLLLKLILVSNRKISYTISFVFLDWREHLQFCGNRVAAGGLGWLSTRTVQSSLAVNNWFFSLMTAQHFKISVKSTIDRWEGHMSFSVKRNGLIFRVGELGFWLQWNCYWSHG